MKMVKSLILGSAAGLIAMSGAQAADLPVKAKAVEYVRICSLYGAGFFYIPGTDTCIKLGGYLRVDTAFNGSASTITGRTPAQPGAAESPVATTTPPALVRTSTVDTRTATEYGVVRTFFDATSPGPRVRTSEPARWYRVQRGVDGWQPPTAVSPAARSASTTRSSSSLGSRSVRRSPRSTRPGSTIRATTLDGLVGGSDDVTGVNQLTYTAQFGNGVSGSIALEDPTAYDQTQPARTSVLDAATCWPYRTGAFQAGRPTALPLSAALAAPDIVGQFEGRSGLGSVPVVGSGA